LRLTNITLLGWLLILPILIYIPQSSALSDEEIGTLSLQVFSAQGEEKIAVIEKLTATGDKSLIPTLVLAMRWTGSNQYVANALTELTGESISHWHEAYQWLQLHPEITPHQTYRGVI